MNNKLICFEGLDGSGKDTQLDQTIIKIKQKDKYQEIFVTREPSNYTEAGKILSQKLKNGSLTPEEALKLFVEDRKELTPRRKFYLETAIILLSRGDLGTYAYQGYQGISFEDIYNIHQEADILIPDLTLFFDVPADVAMERINKRGDHKEFFEEREKLNIIREKYHEAIDKLKNERKIVVIDGTKSIPEVTNLVQEHIAELLGRSK